MNNDSAQGLVAADNAPIHCPHTPAPPVAADTVICRCLLITQGMLQSAIAQGHRSFPALQHVTRCGTACNSCVPSILELLGERPWVRAVVTGVQEEAPDVRAICLLPQDADYPAAEPGQHVIVEAQVGTALVRRSYTLASARGSLPLRLLIKREPQGRFTEFVFGALTLGDMLRITRPRGDFLLLQGRGTIVCLAASIGITPALGLICTAVAERIAQRMVVHYSFRNKEAAAGLRKLEHAAQRLPNLTLIPHETSTQGRLDAAGVAGLVQTHPNATFFLCGPESYLQDMRHFLHVAGVPDASIHAEVFAPAERAERPRRLAGSMRYMLVPPVPEPKPPHERLLRWLGATIGRAINSPLVDVRAFGVSLNPLHIASHVVGKRLHIDPVLPCAYFGVVNDVAENPLRHLPRRFVEFDRFADAQRAAAQQARSQGRPLPPNTPDGDTFVYALPTVKLVDFPKECAVHTEWNGQRQPALVPVYALRGRMGIEHVLRSAHHIDRGVIPYYFFQQVIGRRDIVSCPARQAGGLGSGSYRQNATWAEDRQAANQMFGLPAVDKMSATMAAVLPAVCAEIDEAIRTRPGEVFDLNVLTTKIAYMMIIWTVFGDVEFAEFHELGDELTAAARRMFKYMMQLMYGSPVPAEWARDNLRMRKICREMIEFLVQLDQKGGLTARQRDLPTVRMVLDSAKDGPIDDRKHERLFSLFLPFVFGGHETTGHSLCWTLYELGRRPEVLARLLTEIDAFGSAHPGESITIDRYDERPVTFAVLAETLRYHVLSGPISRMAQQAGEVPPDPETGIGGFRYPQGTLFMCIPTAVHFDPRRWPDPQRFDINRFLPDEKTQATAPLRAIGRAVRDTIRAREEALDLMSFGTGPARCPGVYFNWHESVLVLDALLSRYRFELEHPEREVGPSEHPLIGPEHGMIGVRIYHRHRHPAASSPHAPSAGT